ncbi:MAG: hypothetical protein FJ299_16755 [Planctomycetes bacterium]|nr:hypothetical protein [Planctomycetota bacterium]
MSSGVALRAGAAWRPGEVEAELLAALPFGSFPPAAEPGSQLERWRRFRARRARSRGTSHGLLFPLGQRAQNALAAPILALDNPPSAVENS